MSDILNAVLDVADGFGVFGFDPSTQWGLFRDGAQVVEADSVTAFDYKQDYPLSTYQVEEGGFETFDKVEMPYDVRLEFVTGGDLEARQAMLASIKAIQGSLDVFDAVTPEWTYLSCNVSHVDYGQRPDRGVGLLRVSVHLTQVRVEAAAQYNTATPLTATKAPEAKDVVNNGTVQSQPDVPTGQTFGGTRILPPTFTKDVT